MINVVILGDIEELISVLFQRTAFSCDRTVFSCEDVFFNSMNIEDERLFQFFIDLDKIRISIKTEQKAKGLNSYYSVNFDFNNEMKKEDKLCKLFNLIRGFKIVEIGGDDL